MMTDCSTLTISYFTLDFKINFYGVFSLQNLSVMIGLCKFNEHYMVRLDFHAVILAGVYGIKNLKLKMRSNEEHQYNSPWNIATEFDIDMNFSAEQITSMLEEYEADYHIEMDTTTVAENIYQYTSGYPFPVSAICLDMLWMMVSIYGGERM